MSYKAFQGDPNSSFARSFSESTLRTHSSSLFPQGAYNERCMHHLNLFPGYSSDVAIELVQQGEMMEKEEDEEMQKTVASLNVELRKSITRSVTSALNKSTEHDTCTSSYYFIIVTSGDPVFTELRWDESYGLAVSENARGRVPLMDVKYVSTKILRDEDVSPNNDLYSQGSQGSQPEDSNARDLRIVCVGRTLKLRASSRESMKKWVTALSVFVEHARLNARRRLGLSSIFGLFSQVTSTKCEKTSRPMELIRQFVSERMNYPSGKECVETMLSKLGKLGVDSPSSTEIAEVFHLLNVKSSLTPWFRKFARPNLSEASTQYLMSRHQFQEFLQTEQQESRCFGVHSEIHDLFESLVEPLVERLNGDRYLTEAGFSHLMCCAENNLFHPSRRVRVHQDMTKPLSHYWISSSHNTYLEGHQWIGESSLNRYIDVLMSGCRCVEIDCWDGDDGEPMVTHGWTMTTKLTFRDVIRTVRDYGFVVTPYPLILSLEVHCGPEQQHKMATILHNILGSKLLMHSGFDDFETADLPSPLKARRKVIIKSKVPKPRRNSLSLSHSKTSGLSAQSSRSQIMDAAKPAVSGAKKCSSRLCGLLACQKKKTNSFKRNTPENDEISLLSNELDRGMSKTSLDQGFSKASLDQEVSMTGAFAFSSEATAGEEEEPASARGSLRQQRSNLSIFSRSCSSMSSSSTTSRDIRDQMRSFNPFALDTLFSNLIFLPTTHFPKRYQYPPTSFLHTCTCTSFNENKASKATAIVGKPMMQYHNSVRLSRVYPNSFRTTSGNFDPMPLWIAGFQMVALNFQTTDRYLLLNAGLFMNENGGCGYILKPPSVLGVPPENGVGRTRSLGSNHNQIASEHELEECTVDLRILSGHCLPRPTNLTSNAVINPAVVVTICGATDEVSFQTQVIQQNGFNPLWDEAVSFEVQQPEASILKFEVVHITSGSSDWEPQPQQFVAAAAVPLGGVREGIRWIPLLDWRLHSVEFCGLLVEVRLRGPWGEVRRAQVEVEQADQEAARFTSRGPGGLGSFPKESSLSGQTTPVSLSTFSRATSAESRCGGPDCVPPEPLLEKPKSSIALRGPRLLRPMASIAAISLGKPSARRALGPRPFVTSTQKDFTFSDA